MELVFEVHLPGDEPTVHNFTRDVGALIKIGSFKTHIILTPDVNRTHGLIEVNNHDNVVFIDLGFELGTIINGVRVGKGTRTKIKLGDVVQISDCKIVLVRTKIGDDERIYIPPTATLQNANVTTTGNKVPVENLPSWFNPTSGFKFIDGDGDLVIVLGDGKFVEVSPLGFLNLRDDLPQAIYEAAKVDGTLIAVCMNNGCWHIWDLSTEDENYWKSSRPF